VFVAHELFVVRERERERFCLLKLFFSVCFVCLHVCVPDRGKYTNSYRGSALLACVCSFVRLFVCILVCVCVCVCVRERERERDSQIGIHSVGIFVQFLFVCVLVRVNLYVSESVGLFVCWTYSEKLLGLLVLFFCVCASVCVHVFASFCARYTYHDFCTIRASLR